MNKGSNIDLGKNLLQTGETMLHKISASFQYSKQVCDKLRSLLKTSILQWMAYLSTNMKLLHMHFTDYS